MRKALLIIAIVILVLTPFAAYTLATYSPARADVRYSGYQQELTQQQEADLQESYQQMIDLRKETVTKMVQDGLLTQEEGQQALEQLDEMAAYHAENGYAYGYGMMGYGCGRFDADDESYGRGRFGTNDGYYGPGMMRGYNWN